MCFLKFLWSWCTFVFWCDRCWGESCLSFLKIQIKKNSGRRIFSGALFCNPCLGWSYDQRILLSMVSTFGNLLRFFTVVYYMVSFHEFWLILGKKTLFFGDRFWHISVRSTFSIFTYFCYLNSGVSSELKNFLPQCVSLSPLLFSNCVP